MTSPTDTPGLGRLRALMTDRDGQPDSGLDEETASLVRQSAGGDTAAFQQIVVRYERRVLTLSRRLLGTVEDAQEAMQEVFLRAFRFIHRVDTGRPFEPWLMRIAVNVCRDLARKRGRDQQACCPLRDDEIDGSEAFPDPHTDAVDAERRTMLWSALDQLSPAERSAIVLRDLEGYTTAEVAEIMRISESTVRSQISRARVRLRRAIDQMDRRRP